MGLGGNGLIQGRIRAWVSGLSRGKIRLTSRMTGVASRGSRDVW